MRSLSLTDMEQTVPAPPPAARTPRFSRAQWLLLLANHGAPLALFLGLAAFGPARVAPFLGSSAGALTLAGLWGGLTASVAAMLGLFLLANRAAPLGKSNPRFRALCLFLVWAMTTVLFTAPLCVALFYGQSLVAAVAGR